MAFPSVAVLIPLARDRLRYGFRPRYHQMPAQKVQARRLGVLAWAAVANRVGGSAPPFELWRQTSGCLPRCRISHTVRRVTCRFPGKSESSLFAAQKVRGGYMKKMVVVMSFLALALLSAGGAYAQSDPGQLANIIFG